MKITVTGKHLVEGARASCRFCPVALAIWDATGKTMRVTGQFAHTMRESFELPESVQQFIERFDSKLPVTVPFEFELPI